MQRQLCITFRGEVKTPSGLIMPDVMTTRVLREFPIEEWNRYLQNLMAVRRFLHRDMVFESVLRNADAVAKCIVDTEKDYRADARMGEVRMRAIIMEFDRHLVNYLSTFRLYLDHAETDLKRRFGNKSDPVLHFKHATSHAYDTEFAYRFMYKLRNFVVHCGMPTGRFVIQESANDDYEPTTLKVEPIFVRDRLLNDFDAWSAVVVEGLKELPQEFPVMPIFMRHVELMRKIHSVAIADEAVAAGEAAKAILALQDEPGASDGALVIAEFTPKGPDGVEYDEASADPPAEMTAKLAPVPFEMAARVLNSLSPSA